jgi:hypothetical protein
MYTYVVNKNLMGKEAEITLQFAISGSSVGGIVKIEVEEQGWKIKLPGTITGTATKDKIAFETSPVKGKYEGMNCEFVIKAVGKLKSGIISCDITYLMSVSHTDYAVGINE